MSDKPEKIYLNSRAKNALMGGDIFYKEIVENSPDAIFIENLNGEIIDLNENAAKMLGYKKDDLIGKSVDLIIPKDIKKKLPSFLEQLKTKKYFIVQTYNLHKKGYLIPVEISANLVKVGDRKFVVIISKNLTHRKKEEERLFMLYEFGNRISSSLDLDTIFKIAYDGIKKIVNLDAFTIALVDEKEKKIKFEFTANANTGKLYEKHTIDLDDKSSLTGWIAVHREKLYIKDVEREKLPSNIRLIGEPMLSFLGVPLIHNNEVIGVLTVQSKGKNAFGNEDIQTIETLAGQLTMRIANAKLYRELKISKERYKSLVHASNVGIFTTNLDNRITFVNEKFAEMIGYKKDELINKRIMDFATEEGFKRMMEGTKRRKRGISGVYECSFVRKNGRIIYVEIYASPLRDMEGKITGTIGVIIDITEKKRMEEEIIDAKNQFQILFNTMADPVVIVDFQGVILDITNRVEEITGCKRDEIIGKNFMKLDILTEKSKEVLRKNLMKRMTREKIEPYEVEVITKDGRKISFDVNGVIVSYKGKNADLVVFRDITERKRMEDKIKEEEEKYKKLFNNVGSGVVIIQDEKIVFTNNEFNTRAGYAPEEVIGEKFTKFVSPEMREILLTNYRRRMMNLPVPESYIIKVLRKDGRILWVQLKASPIDWEGKKADMVSLVDITPLKDMKDKLIAIGKFFGEMKIELTEEEIYEGIVNFLCDVLGFRNSAILRVEGDKLKIVKQRGYENANFDIPINGKGITAWVARNNTSYYAPDVRKEKIYIYVNKDIRCEYATPIFVGKKLYGVIDVQRTAVNSISTDERVIIDMLGMHLALALKEIESRRGLERARDIQELMLHIVSHDLKNPLAVISGYAELLEVNFKKEYIMEIEDAVREAENIIQKARTFSKVNMGKIEEKRENINLREVIEKAASIMKRKYENVKIDISKEDVFTIAYPIIKEVFVNLIDNAFKYGADEVKISIKKEDKKIVIRVADNGIGIPNKNKENIFKIFKKIKSRGSGSGLGLSIVKKIVEIHGGRIWVEDNKPKGSVFVIELPKG